MRFHALLWRTPGRRCLIVALALSAPRVHAQQAPPPLAADTSAIVVECRIGDVGAQVMEAHLRRDTVFLPGAALVALAGLDSAGVAGERSLAAASTLLHAAVSFDPSALVVQFADSGTLPVSRRAARARMRAVLRDGAGSSRVAAAPAHVSLVPSAITMSYSAQRDGSIAVSTTSRTFGGSLDAGLAHRAGDGLHTSLSWTRVPADASGGSRIRVGALDELAGATGILITNVPLLRDATLRLRPIMVRVAPGTELELFDDGRLVAADSVGTGAVARLQRAQRYGTHVVRLVAHDANGGQHETRWVESAPDAILPRGTVRYAGAVGRCVRRSCTALMASVGFAPTERITVGAAVTPPTRDSPATRVLHGSLDARIGEASVLSVRRAGDEGTSAELRMERGAGRSFVVRSGDAGAAPLSPLLPLSVAAGHRQLSAIGSWGLPGRAELDAAGALARSGVAIASAVSAPVRFGVVQGSVGASRDGTRPCVGWSVGALFGGMWLARVAVRLRSALLRVREERRATACGSSSRDVRLVLPAGPMSALELSARWDHMRGVRRPVLGVAMRRRIGRIGTAHAGVTRSDGSYVTQSDLAGVVVLDALRRSVSFDVDAAGASATVDGIVYVDDDANGRRDPGEEVIAGAVVRSDDASAVSDLRGVFALTGLAPNHIARLAVDSLSVQDAGLVPTPPVAVVLTPRVVVRVDIALRRVERAP